MPWTPPSSVQTIPVRPLNGGMNTILQSTQLKESEFTVLRNYVAHRQGIQRYSGFSDFAANESVPYTPQDYVTIWSPSGEMHNVLITDNSLYLVSSSGGFEEVLWSYSPGFITIAGGAVQNTDATFITNGILPGDIIRCQGVETPILSVVSETALSIASGSLPDGTYSYLIQRTFSGGRNKFVDYTIVDSCLLMADGKHPLMKFDPASGVISFWITETAHMPGGIPFIPGCVAYHDDRVWAGNTYDTLDGQQRQRIRWSTIADRTDFSLTTAYLDLPYVSGKLERLIPLSDNIVAYFDDAIYMGTRTSYPLAPFIFSRISMGNIGLAGPKAVTPVLGGHVFAGSHDFYLLSENGLDSLDCPVLTESLSKCGNKSGIYAVFDAANKSILFGVPGKNRIIENIWVWEYDMKVWSFVAVSTFMIANPIISSILTINDLTGTIDGLDATYPTIDSMGFKDDVQHIFIEHGGSLRISSSSATEFWSGYAIEAEFQTKDFDFDGPDDVKNVHRLGVKINAPVPIGSDVVFNVMGSTNRGRTWKPLGRILIEDGLDEGYVNFRMAGETVRFRLTTAMPTTPFFITEYTMKVRGGGSGDSRNTQE